MKYFLSMLMLLLILPLPVSASTMTAPTVPLSAESQMPEDTSSFGEGLSQLLQKALLTIHPHIQDALKVSVCLIASVMAVGILQTVSGSVKSAAELAGAACIAGTLLFNTNSMIHLGADTIQEMSEYGKLLYPVLTTALAAQGGITSSAALYAGTTAFVTLLGSAVSRLLLPMVYIFLALSVAGSVLTEPFFNRMKTMIKGFIGWCLKILLTVFTTYLSVTGVVSGTTDAAALKAAKVTISSLVPVVGSILSDASESVLVSASLAKNAAGIYGILAILALFLEPFLKIAIHFLILKITCAVCEILGTKNMTGLIDDFSSAMGLLLAMTGSVCLLLLISTICFLRGAG